jgi:superfamily II DNA or RNA helicase
VLDHSPRISHAVAVGVIDDRGCELFTPRLALSSKKLVVNRGSVLEPDYQEALVPLAVLTFDYRGTLVRASDARENFFRSTHAGFESVRRDRAGEAEARRLLESHGLVEMACLEDYGGRAEEADYVVDLEGDVNALCSFGAHVVPLLRERGWIVDVDERYVCQIQDRPAEWYASASSSDEGWFNLELGVEIDGQRVSLLPVLLQLIEENRGDFELDALAKSRHRYMAVPLGGTKYLPVPPARLRQILVVLFELYEIGGLTRGGALELPLARAGCLEQLNGVVRDLTIDLDPEVAVRARARRTAPAREPRLLQATLRPYQREGVAWLEQLCEEGAGGILADDMGLGKTLQTIAHIVLQKEAGRLDRPALVVAPTSLVGNWRRELERYAPTLRVVVWHGARRTNVQALLPRADVVITTYALLWRDADVFAELAFHLQILDEAQAIKSPRSQAHQAVKRIDARHRLCLTGTPVENRLDELWALFDFLIPGLLGSAEAFGAIFAGPIEKQGKGAVLEALRARIAPFILRRMKHEVARDLPPKTEIVRPVELSGAQRDLYESIRMAAHEQVRSAIRERGMGGSSIDILDALLKLRQVCCDPRLVAVDAARKVTNSAKLDLLSAMLDTQLAAGRKVLVFSQFTSMLELIAAELRAGGKRFVMLTGATVDRQALVDRFQRGEADVFLISLKAGGTGLNLTAADTVIHYDPWWNPAVQAQATDRAYRIGQTRPVFAYNIIASGSVEERILALQQKKRELADGVLGGGVLASLSRAEVDNLFAPLAD